MQDRIDGYWGITKAEVQELNAQLRAKDREAEDLETRHRIEIKASRQYCDLATLLATVLSGQSLCDSPELSIDA